MLSRKWISALLLIGLIFSLLPPETISHAADTDASQLLTLSPLSISTQSGTTAGNVTSLKIKDQSGALDSPAKYVTFSTPASVYQGYRTYKLPLASVRAAITSITLQINFKGPAKSTQIWSWQLFDWDTSQWVVAGNNTGVIANTWSLLTLGAAIANPVRFINKSTREIRLQLTSNNATGDAKLDYEAIIIKTSLLRGLAYSPYRDCQSPNTQAQPSQADIIQDLKIISKMSNGIRTYSSTGISAEIPALARSMGLRVSAGAWLGKDLDANEREIQGLIELAQTVDLESVIVGNEVLLRRDLTEDQLIAYIQRVKSAVSVPVTTAEIGSILLEHPRVMAAVDYEMVHIYPFWDGNPIAGAARFTVNYYHKVQSLSNGKRVVIGETGWPSAGQARLQAIPNPANQYRYATEFITLALAENVEFYYFDAFDEMWKTNEHGVGQHWGLLRANRTPKYHIPSVMIPYSVAMSSLTDFGAAETVLPDSVAPSAPFFVYEDMFSQENKYAPGGWMGDTQELAFNACVPDGKQWPGTIIKASYTPKSGDVNGWAGVYWLYPDGNWGSMPTNKYDLTGYQQLIFQARAEKPGAQIKFFVGGVSKASDGTPLPYPSSIAEPIFAQEADPVDGFINLTTSWQEYHIDLTKADLHHVIDGFGFALERARATGSAVFYLDNIQFVTTLPAPAPLTPIHIYSGERLRAGLDMGVNTSGNLSDWVTDLHGSMMAGYPAGQSWGAIFITVGAPAIPGQRQSLNLNRHRYLSVEMRGQTGGETVSIGIKDKDQLDDGNETKQPVVLTADWKTYTFDLQSSFAGADRTKLYIPIEFVFKGAKAETMYFRNAQYLP
ncbi:MAG: glycosyl hydrolase family 17 protein [Anaerolineales bacterium]